MKTSPSTLLLAMLLATSSLFIAGCANEVEEAPSPEISSTQSDPPAESEDLVLPPDSFGEGSEPKNSGAFGGAIPPEKNATE